MSRKYGPECWEQSWCRSRIDCVRRISNPIQCQMAGGRAYDSRQNVCPRKHSRFLRAGFKVRLCIRPIGLGSTIDSIGHIRIDLLRSISSGQSCSFDCCQKADFKVQGSVRLQGESSFVTMSMSEGVGEDGTDQTTTSVDDYDTSSESVPPHHNSAPTDVNQSVYNELIQISGQNSNVRVSSQPWPHTDTRAHPPTHTASWEVMNQCLVTLPGVLVWGLVGSAGCV